MTVWQSVDNNYDLNFMSESLRCCISMAWGTVWLILLRWDILRSAEWYLIGFVIHVHETTFVMGSIILYDNNGIRHHQLLWVFCTKDSLLVVFHSRCNVYAHVVIKNENIKILNMRPIKRRCTKRRERLFPGGNVIQMEQHNYYLQAAELHLYIAVIS